MTTPRSSPPRYPGDDPGPIHVWFVHLAAGADDGLASLLDDAERARASRYLRPGPGSRFIRARGVLRLLLGAYTGEEPGTLRIDTTEKGKPVLPDHALAFNLSHSGELAAYAVTAGSTVGIDVERLKPVARLDALAQRALDSAEYRQWRQAAGVRDEAVPAEGPDRWADMERPLADFLRRWSRREAVVKATGEGMWDAGAFAVLEDHGGALGITGPDGPWTHWSVVDLEPPAGYVGALATDRPNARVVARAIHGPPDPSILRQCRLDPDET